MGVPELLLHTSPLTEQCSNPSIIPLYWLVNRDSSFLESYNPKYIKGSTIPYNHQPIIIYQNVSTISSIRSPICLILQSHINAI